MKSILIRPNTQWYTDELRSEDCKTTETKSTATLAKIQTSDTGSKQVGYLLHKAKEELYSSQILECINNVKNFLNMTKLVMDKKRESILYQQSYQMKILQRNFQTSS